MNKRVSVFMEDFKDYTVDKDGNVYGKNGKKLKPSTNHRGYQIVNFVNGRKNGKTYRVGVAVHTLIARAFVPGYKPGLQVNHIDGNKKNNKADNLEWVTNKENIRHAIDVLGFRPGESNKKKIFAINKNHDVLYFDSLMDAAKYFNPNENDYNKLRHIQNVIHLVLVGQNKSYKKFKFYYLE